MTFNLNSYLQEQKKYIDNALLNDFMLPTETDPETLHKSMHYSLFAKGKRIRPILCMASSVALGLSQKDVLPIALALEMIHVFSLIHDDLPAMDDDDLRRGQPTNHKVFGEGIAVLAGDNLLAHAFDTLTKLDQKKFSAENIIKVIQNIAGATGSHGMIAGQVIDIESEGKKIDIDRLKKLHRNKTGALIRIACEAPAILSGASPENQKSLVEYGNSIGLAFQIADDILDIEGGKELGKDIGSDIEKGKATYPALMGMDNAKQAASEALDQALSTIKHFGDKAEPLRHLARFIVERKY